MITPPGSGDRNESFRIDDDHPDPESFIQSALDAKIKSLNAAIASAAGSEGERGRLVAMRERYLARRGPVPDEAMPLEIPESERPHGLTFPGAIPQPRRFTATKKTAEVPQSHQAASAKPASHMASFLQGIQATSKNPESQPQPKPQPAPAAGGTGMMSFLKNVQSSTPAPTEPAQTPPPSASPASGGAMLSYLQKMKSGEQAQAPSKEKPKKEIKEEHGELHNELEGLFDELK